MGTEGGFCFYASFGILGFILIFLLLPETKGVSLDKMDFQCIKFNAPMDSCSMARKVRLTQRSIANAKMESANGKMTRKGLSTKLPCHFFYCNK